MQVPDGVGGGGVDQPRPRGQTGAGAGPQGSHPFKWTNPDQSREEELHHRQVARALRASALVSDPFDNNGLCGKVQYNSSGGRVWMDIFFFWKILRLKASPNPRTTCIYF